jgi:hypothetical protein
MGLGLSARPVEAAITPLRLGAGECIQYWLGARTDAGPIQPGEAIEGWEECAGA